ncbi:hypothetical protein [uncultured Flavobacterium sp.]|uniref:hypothetical protein n=1 Tax=uncultured Flavobacterium sp. TaxID=165435 RepID=UPI002592E179|nr:hypothetical protein [uncultured Flavobacterium sp.]
MFHKTTTLLFNWFKILKITVNNLLNEVTKDKIDSALRKIEEENKHLSEIEVINLKRKFLDKIEKKLDTKLQIIESEMDKKIIGLDREYNL